MASSYKPHVRTYFARGTIQPYSFVQLDSTAPSDTKHPGVVQNTTGRAYGISQNTTVASAGDEVEVALPGGGALLNISGTISLGNAIKSTTAGAGIACTTANDYVSAEAVEAGVTGDTIGVHIIQYQKVTSDAN